MSYLKIIFFVLVIEQGANASNWAITVSGDPDSSKSLKAFYEVAQNSLALSKALGIQAQSAVLYGQDNQVCYSEQINPPRLQVHSAFMSAMLGACENSKSIFSYIMGGGEFQTTCSNKDKNLRDLDRDGHDDLAGQSDMSEFQNSITNVATKGNKDEHLLLTLAAHGNAFGQSLKIGKSSVGYGSLADLVKPVIDKGMYIHLNVLACYSGDFTKVNEVLKSDRVCAVTQSTRSAPALGSDELTRSTFDRIYMQKLQTYGTQIEAYACAMGQDNFSQPRTGLDDVVDEWHYNKTSTTPGINPLEIKRLRTSLLKEFFFKIHWPVQACNNNSIFDMEILATLNSCYKRSIDTLSFESFLGGSPGHQYRASRLKAHWSFLKNAPLDRLTEYKAQFCCLSHNFKNNSVPDFCRQ